MDAILHLPTCIFLFFVIAVALMRMCMAVGATDPWGRICRDGGTEITHPEYTKVRRENTDRCFLQIDIVVRTTFSPHSTFSVLLSHFPDGSPPERRLEYQIIDGLFNDRTTRNVDVVIRPWAEHDWRIEAAAEYVTCAY
jgi:hypothetical protein